MTLALPQALTEERKPSGTTPQPLGNPISVSHERAMVSVIKSRLKRCGEPTPTPFNPKRLFASLKGCSIQSLCQYHEAALRADPRLVATYQGSSGCLPRGSTARLFGTLQHKATLIQISRGRSW